MFIQMNEVQLNKIVLNCRLNPNETKQPKAVILFPFTTVLQSPAGSALAPSKFGITLWISLGEANPPKPPVTIKSELPGSIPVSEQQRLGLPFVFYMYFEIPADTKKPLVRPNKFDIGKAPKSLQPRIPSVASISGIVRQEGGWTGAPESWVLRSLEFAFWLLYTFALHP